MSRLRSTVKATIEARVDWARDGGSIALLVVVIVAFFWRAFFACHVLLPLDVLETTEPWKSERTPSGMKPLWNPVVTDGLWSYYPMAVRSAAAWDHGVPLWDPSIAAGMPAWAQGKLYSNPLFIVLSRILHPARAQSFLVIISLMFGALSMFVLLRTMEIGRLGSLVAGLAFALNAHLVRWITDPTFVAAMAFFPAVFLGVELAIRRQRLSLALIGSIAFAAQILSGTILYPFYCAMALIVTVFFRSLISWLRDRSIRSAIRPVFAGAIALGIGALLAAVQLGPTIELYALTPRGEPIGSTSFLQIRHMATLLIPDFFGSPLHGHTYRGPFNPTETGLYFGVLGLLLIPAAMWCRQRVLALGLFAIGATAYLAVFDILPFRVVIETVFPVFLYTFPGRIFIVTAFFWSIVAGMGADVIMSCSTDSPARRWSFAAAVAVLALVGIAALRQWNSDPSATERLTSLFETTMWVLVSIAILSIASPRPWRQRLGSAAMIGLLAADLWWVGADYNPTFPLSRLVTRSPSLETLTRAVADEPQPARALNINSGLVLVGNSLSLLGVDAVSGYSSWILQRQYLYAALTKHYSGTTNFLYFDGCCDPLLNALNPLYIICDPSTYPRSPNHVSLIDNLEDPDTVQAQGPDIHPDRWLVGDREHRVLFAHPPSRVSLRLRPSPASVFRTQMFMDPGSWDHPGDGVRFRIRMRSDATVPPATLVDRFLDPKNNPDDRQPVPVAISLDQWAGREIVLILETDAGPSRDERYDWAAWVDPTATADVGDGLDLLWDGPNRVYRNSNALPRAWLVHKVHTIRRGDFEAAARTMGSPAFDPAAEAVVEGDTPSVQAHEGGSGAVRILRYENERVVIRARSSTPSFLVIADTLYPGWNATVDGRPQPVLATNLMMRGVALDAGDHTVELVFEPLSFRIGLIVSVAAALLLMVVAAIGALSRRRAARSVGSAGSPI